MAEKQIGTGTGLDKKPITVWDNELVIIVRDAAGKKVTHSDTVKGLEQAGYVIKLADEKKPVVTPDK